GLKKRRKNGNLSMSESITLMANFIFQRDVVEGNQPLVEFSKLRYIIEEKDKWLTLFFDEIEAGADMEKKSNDEKKELNRSLAYQCYLICWNRNRDIPLWDLKNKQVEGEKFTWVDGVVVLMNLFYDREKKKNLPLIYSFQELRKEIENKDHWL
ncbi:789_t:CDS:1, partial [Racocetra persica]